MSFISKLRVALAVVVVAINGITMLLAQLALRTILKCCKESKGKEI